MGRVAGFPRATVAAVVKVQYVWDLRYIDAPVLAWRDTGGDPDLDETLYYCNDANMNVTALVEPDGDVAERYVYDPYGSLVHDANGNLLVHSADWSSTVTWPNSRKNEILFGGYRLDPETALYHVRHRQYHPTLGRWLQRDPIGYADGMNPCQFARGSPLTGRDPSGLVSLPYLCGCARVRHVPGGSSIRWWQPRIDLDIAVIGGECTCTGTGVPPTVIAAGMALSMMPCCMGTCSYVLSKGPSVTIAHKDTAMMACLQAAVRAYAGFLQYAPCIACECRT